MFSSLKYRPVPADDPYIGPAIPKELTDVAATIDLFENPNALKNSVGSITAKVAIQFFCDQAASRTDRFVTPDELKNFATSFQLDPKVLATCLGTTPAYQIKILTLCKQIKLQENIFAKDWQQDVAKIRQSIIDLDEEVTIRGQTLKELYTLSYKKIKEYRTSQKADTTLADEIRQINELYEAKKIEFLHLSHNLSNQQNEYNLKTSLNHYVNELSKATAPLKQDCYNHTDVFLLSDNRQVQKWVEDLEKTYLPPIQPNNLPYFRTKDHLFNDIREGVTHASPFLVVNALEEMKSFSSRSFRCLYDEVVDKLKKRLPDIKGPLTPDILLQQTEMSNKIFATLLEVINSI